MKTQVVPKRFLLKSSCPILCILWLCHSLLAELQDKDITFLSFSTDLQKVNYSERTTPIEKHSPRSLRRANSHWMAQWLFDIFHKKNENPPWYAVLSGSEVDYIDAKLQLLSYTPTF